jgi:nicotinate-nucleotide adenylyltransferase
LLKIIVKIENHHLLTAPALPQHEAKPFLQFNQHLSFCIDQTAQNLLEWSQLLGTLPPAEAQGLLQLIGQRFPFAPGYQRLKQLCPEISYQDHEAEWVFFGGSFNPWHQGHQACLDLLPADKTCFILPDHNPLKAFHQRDPVQTMIDLAAAIHPGPKQYLCPTFLLEARQNPTVIWLEKLHQQFPEKKLSLLLGHDSFASLEQWLRYQDLLRSLNTIYIAARMESDQEREQRIERIKKVAPGLKIDFLGRHAFEDAASSKIRNSN